MSAGVSSFRTGSCLRGLRDRRLHGARRARGTSLCPGHILIFGHVKRLILSRLSKALPINGRRLPPLPKLRRRRVAPDQEPTTPRPHEVGSVRRSARQAAAARRSRAGGAAGPSRPASASRSRLDLSPAPVCARTEAVWRCDRRGGCARRRCPRGAADACGAAGWRAGSCSNRVCARCASAHRRRDTSCDTSCLCPGFGHHAPGARAA